MEFEINPTETANHPDEKSGGEIGSSFSISARPVIAGTKLETEPAPLPRSYGTESLSLLARDPRTIFAFWDIDWTAALRGLVSGKRRVHLRLLAADGREEAAVEVEPMAGSCYVPVANSDSAYRGEIGYFDPLEKWHCLASSDLVTTPTDAISTATEVDFATVPFHLSFQRMVELLAATQEENARLTETLSSLRQRVVSGQETSTVTAQQRELARTVEHAAASHPIPAPPNDSRLQRKLERVLSTNSSSPNGGFGGGSRG